MSTRSAIIVEDPTGARGIYCHFDGYPEHHIPILREHFATRDKVEALIAKGDISSLGADGRIDAYADRGEAGTDVTHGASIEAVSELIGHNGHVYSFSVDGHWRHNGDTFDDSLLLIEIADMIDSGAHDPPATARMIIERVRRGP